MKIRQRKASKVKGASKATSAGRARGAWRLFGRGQNRRLKVSASSGQKRDTAELSAAASPSRAFGQRARALLWGVACSLLVIAALGSVGVVSFFGYRALRSSHAFDVKTIEVQGARQVLPAEVRARVAAWQHTSIFAVDRVAMGEVVQRHPWVRRARVVRVLPNSLRIVLEEQRAVAVVLLDVFYLVNEAGDLFKRATQAEADGLTVLTGPTRAEFLVKRQRADARIRIGLKALSSYQAQIRPALSEVHVGGRGEVTFFLRKSGTALRFGRMLSGDRLRQLDAVWAALGPKSKRARALYLDHEVRANRVIVRMNDDRE
ncbi:MAG: FtsQ-type POTRA domain-containing protein [Deltaproteobacteria bacterium]|nr:FtsQ-type POTRA domain-containing protein [Deltaproteobacteria bacterium]